jgi:hypothetical protein
VLHTGRRLFFSAPTQEDDARLGNPKDTLHFGQRHEASKSIRVTQLPPLAFCHAVIEATF